MVQPEIILELQGIGEEAVGSPGDSPFSGHGGARSQCLLDNGVIHSVSIEQGGIWRQNLPVELGAEDSALELLRMVVPVPHQNELPCGGIQECKNPRQDLGIGGALDRFIGFEVDGDDQDGSCLCFREKSLVSTAFNLKSLQLG